MVAHKFLAGAAMYFLLIFPQAAMKIIFIFPEPQTTHKVALWAASGGVNPITRDVIF